MYSPEHSTSEGGSLLKFRRSRPGPEDTLVNAFINNMSNSKQGKHIILREPELLTGYPDIVICYFRKSYQSYQSGRSMLTLKHFRLLHHIFTTRGDRIESLSYSLTTPPQYVASIVSDLLNVGFLVERNGFLRPISVEKAFALSRIVAIEAKIDAWKGAIEQAATNNWFSSHSYILVPQRSNIDKILNHAGALGVGVIAMSTSGYTKTLSHPTRNKIPRSYGSWLINEWALQRVYEEGPNGC